MKKFSVGFVLLFCLMISQVSAVGLFINWPDGGEDFREFPRGQDITFNYEAYDNNADVYTQMYLIHEDSGLQELLVETTDYENVFRSKNIKTDNKQLGAYTIYGIASARGAVQEKYLDFLLVEGENPNTPPYFVGLPTNFEYKLSEESAIVLNAETYVRDDEGDTISITLDKRELNTSVAECKLYFETSMNCTFNARGTTTLDLVASDGEFFTRETITLKVVDDMVSNTPPYFQDLPGPFTYELSQGFATVFQLSDFAFDDENDPLTFDVSGGDGIVDCDISSQDELACAFVSAGTTKVNITVTDSEGLSTWALVTINILDDTNRNTAPYFVNIPKFFEFRVGQGSADVLDLSDYAVDDEGDDLMYSVIESIGGTRCEIVQDSILRCTFNQEAQGTFAVVVSDGQLSNFELINIHIVQDPDFNTAPYWDGLPFNYYLDADRDVGIVTLANLRDFAFDDEGDSLSFIFGSQSNSNVASCFIDAQELLKCDVTGQVGSSDLYITVSDGDLSASQTITIFVEDLIPNNPPVWDENIDLSYRFNIDDSPVFVFDVDQKVSDPDGDDVTFVLDESVTNFDILNCFLSGGDLICNLRGIGTTTVDIIATDGEFDAVVSVTIEVFEDDSYEPYVFTLPDRFDFQLGVDGPTETLLDVKEGISGKDPNQVTFTIDRSENDPSVADCRLEQRGSRIDLDCDINGAGDTAIRIRTSDGVNDQSEKIWIYVEEAPRNHPPRWSTNLDRFYQYHIDETPATLAALRDFVSDPDGDAVTIELIEDNTDFDVVNCFLSTNDLLICQLRGVGTTSFDLKATDGTDDSTITITVEVYDDPNQKPYFDDIPMNFEYNIDEEWVEVLDISKYVIDPDGDLLHYDIDESETDLSVIECNLHGARLRCDLNGVGTTTIDVVVSDGEFEIRKTLTINVFEIIPENLPPYWKSDMPMKFDLHVGDNHVRLFDLKHFARDPDNDELYFWINTSQTDEYIATCQLHDTRLKCGAGAEGETTLDVVVSDGEFIANKTITIHVAEKNYAPEWKSYLPDDFRYDIDEYNVDVLDLSDFVSDPNGDKLSFSVEQSSTKIVTCRIKEDSLLNCDLNSIGYTSVTVVVSDGEFEVSERIRVEVYQDNEAPYFINIPTYFKYDIDEVNVQVLNLANYVEDPDDDNLDFELNSTLTDPSVIDCTLQYQGAILHCNLNGVGITTIDVVVKDDEFTISKTITIEVYQDDARHEWDENIPTSFKYPLSSSEVTVLRVSDYVINTDDDTLRYVLNQGETDEDIITCSLNDQTDLLCDLNGIGTTTIDIRVSDDSYTIVETLTIEVYDDNTVPYFKEDIQTYFELNIDEGVVNLFDLGQEVVDPDGDILSFSLDESQTDKTIFDCSVQGDDVVCDLYGLGISTVDIIASDGKATISKTITILVFEVNDKPFFDENIPTHFSFPISQGDANLLQVSTVVSDPNNDELSYAINTANTDSGVIDCDMDSQSLVFCDLNAVGDTSLFVVVSDGEFSVSKELFVEVYDDIVPNTPPYFDQNIPTYFEYPLSLSQAELFKVSDFINDDGDQISLILDTSNTDSSVVDCSLAVDSVLSCEFNGVGSTTVTLEASDGEFTVSELITIVVVDDMPAGPVAIISADSNRNVVGEYFYFNGDASFAVSNHQIIDYDWTIRDDEGLVIALLSGSAQNYRFTSQGQYVLELTVTDTQGLQDTAYFTVQSRNAKSAKRDFGPEEGIFVNSLEIYGTDFERAEEYGELLIVASIENTADEDLKNVRMVFTIPELGYKIKSNAIVLKEGERETIQIFEYLPDYVTAGVYYPVISFSDSEVRRSKPMYLEVHR